MDPIQGRYEKRIRRFLTDKSICKENRQLCSEYFTELEYKLKRINGLRELDANSYQTLYTYITRINNVNKWFNNKPFIRLTEKDIQKVYDDLEDGKITRPDGGPYQSLPDTYYNKIFKSTLFEMAGKAKLAKKIIKYIPFAQKEVRFVTEESFMKMVKNAYKAKHKLLLWLAWDIGENIGAMLQLRKNDCTKQMNPYTKEGEYRIHLRKEILKRSRKPRSEITNYNETVELLDEWLSGLNENNELFSFDYASAKKIFDRIVQRSKIVCMPKGDKPTWKDLRSGMACDLLKKGWSTDEVNARLGHKPSSDEIDKYINFLAIDRHRPKKKVHQFEMGKLQDQIGEMKNKEKLYQQRMAQMEEQMTKIRNTIAEQTLAQTDTLC